MHPPAIKLGELEVSFEVTRQSLYRYGRNGGDLAKLQHPTQAFAESVDLVWACLPAALRRDLGTPEQLAAVISPGDKAFVAAACTIAVLLMRLS